MDAALHELLRDTSTDTVEQGSYTLFSHFGPRQTWSLKNTKLSEFWQGYCGIAQEEEGPVVMSISERMQSNAPIVLHGKLRFHHTDDQDEPGNYYDQQFLLSFVRCCQVAMEELLTLSESRVELLCCVLESERAMEEADTVVTSFRVQFPYCRPELNVQMRLLRPRIIQLLRTTNVMSMLQEQPIGDWESIIDPTIPVEHLPMYRSVTEPNQARLDLNYIWPVVTDEHIKMCNLESLDVAEVFRTTNNHQHVQQGLVRASIFAAEVDYHHWLPMFLSGFYWIGVTTEKVRADIPTVTNTKGTGFTFGAPRTTTGTATNPHLLAEESDLQMAERLLPMLNNTRVSQENYWLDVGRALWNSDRGGDQGLRLWIRFTERTADRGAEDCRLLYYTFQDTQLTIKTLGWYAREDSPEAYRNWHRQWCQAAMEKAASCLHSDVAEALYRVYWLDFTCASISANLWFRFHEHRHIRIDRGVDLSTEISRDFLRRFEVFRLSILQHAGETQDTELKEKYEAMNKKLSALIAKLKTVSYKSNIMTEAREKFYHSRFLELMDRNRNLLGMYNCVLEACGDRIYDRPGKPEDYLSMCTGIPYRKEFTWATPSVVTLMRWLHQVFVDEALFNHVMKDFASFLIGGNAEKIFRIWSGDGDNSKSMIVKLFEAAFGSYVAKIPVELVLAKRQTSSGPQPELAQTKSTHAAIMEEPDDDEPMRKGMIKRFTGGDSFFARFLMENGGKMDATFKLILMCNKIPKIPNGDRAIRNRLRVIPFFSKWVKTGAPATEAEQMATKTFKQDPFFDRKIPELAQAFIWVLVQYFPRYMAEGLAEEPEIIQAETRKYWDENDCYQMFANECLQPAVLADGETRDENATLTASEIYAAYKPWFKDNFPGIAVTNSTVAKEEFLRVLGPQRSRRWYGVRLRSEDGMGFAQIQI